MASILVGIEHKISIAATDVLSFLARFQSVGLQVEPEVVASLAVLIGSINTAMISADESTKTPWNLSLDMQTINDLRATWPAVLKFMEVLGVKL